MLQVKIVKEGDADEGHLLKEYVQANCVLLTAPALVVPAFLELVKLSPSAGGYHKKKQRATVQSTELDKIVGQTARFKFDSLQEIEDNGESLGDWVGEVRDLAAGPDGEVINDFLNINKGEVEPGEDEDDGFHTDSPSEPERNSGRCLFYVMEEGRFASLRVRRGGAEVEVVVPRGSGIYCTVALLALPHAHGANGRCISYVVEVARPESPEAPSAEEVAAASEAQPAVPLREHFGNWRPEMFTAAKLKWGAGRGVGSTRRVVIQALRGPKVGRGRRRAGLSRRDARAAVAQMQEGELQRRASEFMQGLGLASAASQGHDMLAFIASPGEKFSAEDARWWKGHNLGITWQAHRATVERIRSSSKTDLTAAQVAARSRGLLSTEEVEAADRLIEGMREGMREGTRRAAEICEAKAEAQGGRSEAAARSKRHREAATQQGPFGCPRCFKMYKSKDGRNKHLRQGKCYNDEEEHAAAMEELGLGGGKGSGQRGV